MLKIGLFLDGDSNEFPEQAKQWSSEASATCFPFEDALDMLERADMMPTGKVSQLTVFAHGTTNALGRPGRWGVDIRPARNLLPAFVSPEEFARAWAPTLTAGALISLAACLCGRSQHWYLQGKFGKLAATYATQWGQESYENGGATSFAQHLTRAFAAEGATGIRVRAHCAAGHCTHQALLREFRPGMDRGLSLFRTAFPSLQWTTKARNRWQALVKGQRAERWLLGDDTVVDEVRQAW